MRINTEGEWAILEHHPVPSVAEHIQVATRYNTKRVSEYAFKYAREKKKSKVTLMYRQDVNPMQEAVLIRSFDETAKAFPEITSEKYTLNHGLKKFIKCKREDCWDVLVTNNMVGAMVISVLSGVMGSASLLAESNIGNRYRVFEPAFRHKKLTEENEANPTATIMSAVLALESVGQKEVALNIRHALNEIYRHGEVLTKDLGGTATSKEFTKCLIGCLQSYVKLVQCKHDSIPKLPPKPKEIKPYDPKTDTIFMPGNKECP